MAIALARSRRGLTPKFVLLIAIIVLSAAASGFWVLQTQHLAQAPPPPPSAPHNPARVIRYARTKLVIVAAHQENTQWASDLQSEGLQVSIYRNAKDPSTPITAEVKSGNGHEARSYIAGILEHWDNLPDAVAFVHGHETSWHTVVGQQMFNTTSWILRNIKWPVNEGYFSLSCNIPSPMHLVNTDSKVHEWTNIPAYVRYGEQAVNFTRAWNEHFEKWLHMKKPEMIGTSCCGEFIATREAIQSYPREFYTSTIDWLSSTSISFPALVMEYMWHILYSREHRGVWPWMFLQETCLCYMYNMSCDSPSALFHGN